VEVVISALNCISGKALANAAGPFIVSCVDSPVLGICQFGFLRIIKEL